MINNNMYSSYIGINNAFFFTIIFVLSNKAKNLTIILTLSSESLTVSQSKNAALYVIFTCLKCCSFKFYRIIMNVVQNRENKISRNMASTKS